MDLGLLIVRRRQARSSQFLQPLRSIALLQRTPHRAGLIPGQSPACLPPGALSLLGFQFLELHTHRVTATGLLSLQVLYRPPRSPTAAFHHLQVDQGIRSELDHGAQALALVLAQAQAQLVRRKQAQSFRSQGPLELHE
jgi:hypothetical protein